MHHIAAEVCPDIAPVSRIQLDGNAMKSAPETKSVDTLMKWKRNKLLAPNPEYQRGAVWTLAQKKRLVHCHTMILG
jgi:hypothetical protein